MRRAIARACLCMCLRQICAKKASLVWFKKLQGVCLKQSFLSFTFYITQRSYEKTMCIYFLFPWFSCENCVFLFSSHKEQQTLKEFKRNMIDGKIIFSTSLLIILTWKILLQVFSFLSTSAIKKSTIVFKDMFWP